MEPTNTIILNSADVEIRSVVFKLLPEGDLLKPQFQLSPKNATLVLILLNQLQKGEAQLTIAYTGILNDERVGFYRSSYSLWVPTWMS